MKAPCYLSLFSPPATCRAQLSTFTRDEMIRLTASNTVNASTSTDQHLWAESYDRDFGDVLSLQGEISPTIADEIRLKLRPQRGTQVAKHSRVDPQAEKDYVLGRHHLNKGSEEEISKVI